MKSMNKIIQNARQVNGFYHSRGIFYFSRKQNDYEDT